MCLRGVRWRFSWCERFVVVIVGIIVRSLFQLDVGYLFVR